MSQILPMQDNSKKLLKSLTKAIKKVVSDQGINPTTKKGNKELSLLLKNLSKKPFTSQAQAESYGEKLGAVIVEVSKAKGKVYLDKGVIREISLQNKLPALPDSIPATSNQVSQPTEKVKSQPEIPTTKEVSKAVENLKATEETIEEDSEIEDLADDEAELEEDSIFAEDNEEEAELVDDETEDEKDSIVAEDDEIVEEAELEENSIVAEDDEEIEEVELEENSIVAEDDEKIEETVIEEDLETPEEISEEEIEPVAEENKRESTNGKDANLMSLKDRLTEDIKVSMKAKDKIRLETVRGIKKALLEKEVSVRPSGQTSLTEDQEIELLAQQAKQRRESIEQYQKAEREDLADKESQELAIIETYLPKQLSDEELETVLDEIITSVGATSSKDIGKVMGTAMKQLKGKADGKKIQSLVKSKLG